MDVGELRAIIRLELGDFQKNMQSVRQQMNNMSNDLVENGKKVKEFGKSISDVGKEMSAKITAPILAMGGAAFKFASDTSESLNKVDVAFKSSAGEVKKFASTTLQNFGIARGTSLDMAALFGDMATSMGMPVEKASKMSMSLVGLAGDLASFKNISVDVAQTALNSIFTGETESLKSLGIVMTETNLQNFALSNGIKTKVKDMTEAQKVQLRYAYVMSVTKNAQGDFARTQDGAANQMRIFTESLKELAASFGDILLPIFTPIISKANEMIQKFGALDEGTKKTIVTVGGIVAAIGPVLMVVGSLVSGVGSLSIALAPGGTLATGLTAISGAFAGILATILAVVAVIAVLVGSFVYLFKTNEAFKNNIIASWNDIKTSISSIVTEIKAIFDGFMQGISENGTLQSMETTFIHKAYHKRLQVAHFWHLPRMKL